MALRADLGHREMWVTGWGSQMENKDWEQAGREAAEKKILGKERAR